MPQTPFEIIPALTQTYPNRRRKYQALNCCPPSDYRSKKGKNWRKSNCNWKASRRPKAHHQILPALSSLTCSSASRCRSKTHLEDIWIQACLAFLSTSTCFGLSAAAINCNNCHKAFRFNSVKLPPPPPNVPTCCQATVLNNIGCLLFNVLRLKVPAIPNARRFADLNNLRPFSTACWCYLLLQYRGLTTSVLLSKTIVLASIHFIHIPSNESRPASIAAVAACPAFHQKIKHNQTIVAIKSANCWRHGSSAVRTSEE